MNQQVAELRNVFVGFSQKIGNLEKKVDLALENSQKAQEYGELARDISLRHLQGDLQQLEIETIRKLFSGSSPSLDEIITMEQEEILHTSVADIFETEKDGERDDDDDDDDDNKDSDPKIEDPDPKIEDPVTSQT